MNSPIDSSINTNWSDELNIQITQPLMRGRGRALYEANERRATLSRDAPAVGAAILPFLDRILPSDAILIKG